MKKTGDLGLVKKINQSIVLDVIRRQRPISRAAIAQKTGLTKATVSNQVQTLIDSHLVREIGIGDSSGGRKPVLLTFNPRAGWAIGIDLGVHALLAVLTDLDGTILERREVPLTDPDEDAVIRTLAKCVRNLADAAPPAPYGIVGIGLGVPGIVRNDGTVLLAPNLGWRNVPLLERLQALIGLPVTIDNEANAGAVGEKEYGAGRDYPNQIYVSISAGIGTGIILNNQLYRGAMGYSGEMGHTTIDIHGPRCRCGNIGCWELYASETFLLREAARHPELWLPGTPPRELGPFMEAARLHSPQALRILREMGIHLATGLVNLIHAFNPELVVVSTRTPDLQRWLEPSMREELGRRLIPYHGERLKLQFSSLGAGATVLGAVTLAVSRFLSEFTVKLE